MTETAPILDALRARNSAPRLTDPGPDDRQVDAMIECALRSPDHAWLRPWRFVSVSGGDRAALGELFEKSLLRREPDADEAARSKARAAPLRAPRMLIVLAAHTEHPKVPRWEQQVSTGCAAYSVLLAAEAMGFAAVWRTGAVAEDPAFVSELGAAANEKVIGFLYLGTRDGDAKALPELRAEDFHRHWRADADNTNPQEST